MTKRLTAPAWFGETVIIGSNRSLRYFPDIYANYWIYAFDVNPLGVGLKISGNYPDARFFNFVLNDEGNTTDIMSLEDVNIKPNDGSINPFVTPVANPTQNSYEVYVLPDSLKGKNTFKNVLYYPDTLKSISIIMRCYVPADGATGETPLPTVTAFNAHLMTPVPLPPRILSGLDTLPAPTDQSYAYAPASPFFRSPEKAGGYPNTPAKYLFAANRLKDGEVFAFRFKPPKEPANVSEYATADVRYWSVCIGDAKTYAAAAIKDKDFKQNNGWVTVIMADPDSPNYEAIKAKVAGNLEMNLIAYKKAQHGAGFLVLYRNMVIRENYAYHMEKVEIVGTAPLSETISSFVLGEYGPAGKMYTETNFLADDFSVDNIRNLTE